MGYTYQNIFSSILATQDKQNKTKQGKTLRCVDQIRAEVRLLVLETTVITQATVWQVSMSSTQTNIYGRMDRLDLQTEEYQGITMVGNVITTFKYDFQISVIFT